MKKQYINAILALVVLLSSMCLAQAKPQTKTLAKPKAQTKTAAPPLTAQQKFVIDVVQTAVALPQGDQQDRLRVLTSAAKVVGTVRPALAKQFAKEGMRIEQELISTGETPSVSILDAGHIDCSEAQAFVENVPVEKVGAAEQSLIAAQAMCPKQATEPVRRKIEAGLEQGSLAPRALLATIEAVGSKTPWAQQQFLKFFSSLPSNAEDLRKEAPNYAAMYDRMAPDVDKDSAQKAGIKLLLWLGKMKEGGARNLALNIVTGSMKTVLGQKGYDDALASDVMARQLADSAGQPGDAERPEEESVSVLQAMNQAGVDRLPELQKMSPSIRAREAAASGFASGTNGDRKLAGRYFDLAFSSVNDVWSQRTEKADAPAVVEEVSEAAAQVDAVDALKRAQRLQDPSASAIGMIAVARVVAGQQQ
jgi:hypothetical protein